MGGGGSTRRITIEEDEATGMVKVSEDVLKRMLGQDDDTFGSKQNRELYPSADVQKIEEEWKSRFQESEKTWQDRLQKATEKNANLDKLTTEEVQKAAEEVEQKFRKQCSVPVCENFQDVVLKCFQENPKEPLKCSKQVSEFIRCVEQARTSILTKKSLDDAAS